MASEAKIDKLQRSSKEQLEYFVNYCIKNPAFQLEKNGPLDKNCINRHWENIAVGLNSLRGPTRSSLKWKEMLNKWSKARKIRMTLKSSGGCYLKKFTDFEKVALETFGEDTTQGFSQKTAFGMVSVCEQLREVASANPVQFSELPISDSGPCSPMMYNELPMNYSGPSSPMDSNQLHINECVGSSPISTTTNRKMTTEEMVGLLVKDIEERNKRDQEMLQSMKDIKAMLFDIKSKFK